MRTDSVKKYVIPNIPYLFIGWACLKLGTAYRLAPGVDLPHIKHRESARYSACFVVRGFQRGLPLGTRLCLQSVVCYTLCRRCCENAVATREGKGI